MLRVKICGITNRPDAEEAVRCGADALGFIFAKSPRKISSQNARLISRAAGPWVSTVGVFVNETLDRVRRAADRCRLSAIQLHGEETVSYVKRLSGYRVIKAFRVGPDFSFKKLGDYDVDAYLFDTYVEGQYGGSGKGFDWEILQGLTLQKPFIISGGLSPDNVASVLKHCAPYGVDVSSGVEKSPGKKDFELMRKFIANAKKPAF